MIVTEDVERKISNNILNSINEEAIDFYLLSKEYNGRNWVYSDLCLNKFFALEKYETEKYARLVCLRYYKNRFGLFVPNKEIVLKFRKGVKKWK